jgi:FkbM family methyltransferase
VISYAQNFEDVILWRALKEIKNGFYVDVGANHPTSSSVTKWFYDNGWNGINIEPHPYCFELLKSERPRDINLQFAISDVAGEIDFYLLNAHGLSTASLNIAALHTENGFEYESIKVRSDTLDHLLDLYAKKEIHFLKIDIEGFEEIAISSFNFTVTRPWIFCVEATKPMSTEENYNSWEKYLLRSDYIFCYEDGLNRFYLSKEKAYLFPRFALPPGVFDNFIKYQEGLDEILLRNSQLEDELLALKSSKSWRITQPLRNIIRMIQKLYS